ncbi:MAG: tetratricopeptide repeat protein [Bacillota bacterium]|nr:tetratricopeptide repeat protein [Bacillota bacterium]
MIKKSIFTGNKTVPFEQEGDFFHKKACSHLENSNYFEALYFFRKALQKEPDNAEYKLALAQTFTEMGHFEESNRIIAEMLSSGEIYSECYYGMGCNFLGLEEYERAEDSFRQYLSADPEGEFAEEVDELLEAVGEGSNADPSVGLVEDKLQRRAFEAKERMDEGDYTGAIAILQGIKPKNEEEAVQIQNGISMAYFCQGDCETAVRMAKSVLAEHPSDLHARCNLLLFAHSMGNEGVKQECLQNITPCETDDPKLLSIIAYTLCETGCHEEAYSRLKKLMQYKPYDTEVIYLSGAAAYNSGRYAEASRLFERLLEIDPEDLVACYYKTLALKCQREKTQQSLAEYSYQLPYDQVIQNIRRINEIIKIGPEHMESLWKKDEEFQALMKWGMSLKDMTIKRAILELISSFGDARAQKTLRAFIFKREEPDTLKNDVFTMLKYMGAREPYIAYINGKVVEVRVSVFNQSGRPMPAEYSAVIRLAMRNMEKRRDETFSAKAMEIWEKFIAAQGEKLPKLFDHGAWAAALEYYTCTQLNIKAKKFEICKAYGTRASFMYKRLAEIKNTLEKGD